MDNGVQIKTYPLQFTAGYLKRIEKVAGKRQIKAFMQEAIDEKLEREEKK